ncbi:uncharacterized protein YukE [Paenibacillus sp. DS2015]|uniref:hypothetical protein n=1 Tax=Paenibacillus sp. DS2015 TaxID=3373917 RepID=UPI003D1FB13E
MASQITQKFDFGEADKLKGKLGSEISKIESDLNNMAKQVAGVTSWWSGGSEVAFIENFEKTKKQVVSGLNEWLTDYKLLIDAVKKNKEESDTFLANQLRK